MDQNIKQYSESTPILGGKIKETSFQNGGHSDGFNSGGSIPPTGYDPENSHGSDVTASPEDGPDDQASTEDTRFRFSKIPCKKKIILCLCMLASFLAASGFSILRLFYPLEAKKKGLDLTMIGFVIGVYQLIVFLVSPLIGNFMSRIGTRFVFTSGVFIGGCSTILFGLLGEGPGGTIFLVMCTLVRSLEAVGFAAFMTASMTIASSEFEHHAASVLGLMKGAEGAGHMVGPVLGGVLFDIGGFGLPFYVFAIPVLLNGVFIYGFLPSKVKNETVSRKSGNTVFDLLRSPLVLISLTTLFINLLGMTLYFATFADYMIPFGYSSTVVGAIYTIGPGIYALINPLWGYISDVLDKYSVLIVVGHLIACVAWFVSYPTVIFPFMTFELWNVVVCMVCIGVSVGCMMIAPMKGLVLGAVELEYKKCPDTFAMVSGLFNSVSALGGFIGPVAGGALIQRFGYSSLFLGFGLLHFGMTIISAAFFTIRHLRHRKTLATSN